MNYKEKLKRNIKLSYIISFLTGLIFIIPIWVAFERRILDFTQIAVLHAFAFGFTTFLEMPTGALADLLGRKKTIFLGWLISAVGFSYFAFADSLTMFIFGFFLRSLGETLVSGADSALIFDSFKELKKENNYAQYAAKAGLIYRTALAIAAMAGGFLYGFDIKIPYLAMGASQLLSLIFVSMLQEPKIDTDKFSLKSYIAQTKEGIRELFKSSHTTKLTIYYVLVGGITWSCLTYYNPPFARESGYTEAQLGILFGVIYLLSSLLIVAVTKVKGLVTRERIYIAFPIIMAVSLLPGLVANKFLTPLLLLGILFVGSGRFAFLGEYTNMEFESKYRATAISALNMLVNLFFILVVASSGVLQDIYGTKLIFTLLGSITILIILPSGISLIKEQRKLVAQEVK